MPAEQLTIIAFLLISVISPSRNSWTRGGSNLATIWRIRSGQMDKDSINGQVSDKKHHVLLSETHHKHTHTHTHTHSHTQTSTTHISQKFISVEQSELLSYFLPHFLCIPPPSSCVRSCSSFHRNRERFSVAGTYQTRTFSEEEM